MEDSLIKILIPAVGGQGGGVLTEWIYQALLLESYEVQTISLPGLAQRTGSTVYYIEAYPAEVSNKIIFSQYPVPGDINIIVAQEFLELGRVLEQGYGSNKTTIVSSTHRVYSTLEKLPISGGIYSDEKLSAIARQFSSKFIGINSLEIARTNGLGDLAINAILLGVLSASNTIPISKDSFIKSIENANVAVESNLNAFDVGYEYFIKSDISAKELKSDSENFGAYSISDKDNEKLYELFKNLEGVYPSYLNSLLKEALVRLSDYQDVEYATKYLGLINEIKSIEKKNSEKEFKLLEIVIKNLALMMSYEDGIRVSELKVRSSRFARIEEEMSIKGNQVYSVRDYLKPDAEEIYGLLPNILVRPVVRFMDSDIFKRIWKKDKLLTLGQTPRTNSFFGYLRLWTLSRFKFIRPYSYRYKNEHLIIKKYIESIEKYGNSDYELGCIVAKSGSIIKGYGKVRRRTINTFHRFLDNVVCKLYNYESSNNSAFKLTKDISKSALELISETEDGIEKAEELVGGSIH